MKELVDRFLSWSLPTSVCVDQCAAMRAYPHERTGTTLLTADEAEQMLRHVAGPLLQERDRLRAALTEIAGKPYLGRSNLKAANDHRIRLAKEALTAQATMKGSDGKE